MDTSQLKTYAPEARRAFIEAVSAQAARLGITAKNIAPAEVQGDVLLVEGKALPKAIAEPRRRLVDRIHNQGFGPTMEAVAYTWFNRLVAIRYMELHSYLDHGYRVLSHPEDLGRPEILDHATDVDLPGLDTEKVVQLKLDGTKDEELYRLLLKAQCNALHEAMPFLFERIGDETELLLPSNLLHTDSLVRKLVEEIDEDTWQEIEIIGWLYQFYISEKKGEVIGKVVKPEDIPAATQLFTPNWIVKYMVQNSLGAQWLATYPNSPLKGKMEYYIEPAEQTEEVQAKLDSITPDSLDPEKLTLIDPACGSGHILVEAYELFKAIYLERGYRQRDVAKVILEKNLFGLEICERAAQLTGFALMMKGRADDRRLFERSVKLNVLAFQNSDQFDAERLIEVVRLSAYGLQKSDLTQLKELFDHAKTFGSLIQVPEELANKLPALRRLAEGTGQDLFSSEALKSLEPLVQQAELLATQYDAVVANPPYMGRKFHSPLLKDFLSTNFRQYKNDLFAAFVDRDLAFGGTVGRLGFMSPFVWMFISSHEDLRTRIAEEETITSLVQLEYSGFEGATVPVCTFTLRKGHIRREKACFIRLSDFRGSDNQGPKTLEAIEDRDCGWFFEAAPDDFRNIPGSPITYWLTGKKRRCFNVMGPVSDLGPFKRGIATGDNDRFVRFWHEVDVAAMATTAASHLGRRWFKYNKGGDFRKWYGNLVHVVDWYDNGHAILNFKDEHGKLRSRPQNVEYNFWPVVTYSSVTSGSLSVRFLRDQTINDQAGNFLPCKDEVLLRELCCFFNSRVATDLANAVNPTLNTVVEDLNRLPFRAGLCGDALAGLFVSLHQFARADWDAYERSWDFQSLPILTASSDSSPTLESSHTAWITQNRQTIVEMKRLEEENNRLFIDAYGLADELTPDVPIEQITLTVNPAYRYGGKLTEEEQWTRFRQDTMQELVSYAIGCMMGRYSLDEPGLIYAHSGNEGFEPSRYETFSADEDGIIPITDTDWFSDDAVHRLVAFLSVAWDPEHLEENLTFLADNLSPRKNESSRETLRRYLCDSFFRDHLQTYKKRPIYWLFSSGKQKAFQCLVYLHRYHEGTLARMRSEYVIPLQGKMAARIEQLAGDIEGATSAAHRKRLEKERDKLEKQQVELLSFDEKLRHYADKRIELDLDDGVKANYGKFGDLLAEVKKVHGEKATDA